MRRRQDRAIVVVVCDEHRPCGDADAEDDGGYRQPLGGARRSFAEVSDGPQGQIGRAVQGEHRHHCEPGGHRVGGEQVDDPAGEHVRGVERHALDEVGECDSPEEGGADAPDRVRPQPRRPPARPLVLLAPLERDHTHDQQHEDQEQRDVEAREQRRVPRGERGEGRSGSDHQPHLVAVPYRPDRLEHEAALALVARQYRQQHADAEVEPLEQEVAAPKDADHDEPDLFEAHVMHLPGSGGALEPGGWIGSVARNAASGRSRRHRAWRTAARTRLG